MDIVIRQIEEKDYASAHAFQCEYLDREGSEEFLMRMETAADFYIAAFLEEELVGICYGAPWSKDPSAIGLQGIAVNLDEKKGLARKGIGSMLLHSLEEIVREKGYRKITLGSADDEKVEKFYLKNGYEPCELVAKGLYGEEYERIPSDNYEEGLTVKKESRQKYKCHEVIFIFQKYLKP